MNPYERISLGRYYKIDQVHDVLKMPVVKCTYRFICVIKPIVDVDLHNPQAACSSLKLHMMKIAVEGMHT